MKLTVWYYLGTSHFEQYNGNRVIDKVKEVKGDNGSLKVEYENENTDILFAGSIKDWKVEIE